MTTSLVDEYFRQRSDVVEASQTPRTVIFSHEGYTRAMAENLKNSAHFGSNAEGKSYCGLPYVIDRAQTAELVVTHEYKHEVERKLLVARPRQNAITVKIDGIMGGAPVVEILAGNLKAAQLQDICRAWLDADDATHWGDFEKGLDELITKHGRFE